MKTVCVVLVILSLLLLGGSYLLFEKMATAGGTPAWTPWRTPLYLGGSAVAMAVIGIVIALWRVRSHALAGVALVALVFGLVHLSRMASVLRAADHVLR